MPTIDGWLEGFLQGPTTLWVVLVVSLLVGLRHASDPDHLAAVTTLIASEEQRRITKATHMGLLWGLGHGTTLIAVGLPLVLLGQYLPERVGQAAEVAIGLIIVVLALRLLVRWRRGVFHAHAHSHTSGETHRHLHSHASGSVHWHTHDSHGLRTPLSAYGVGLVHGVGGSGGITLLLLSTIEEPSQAVVALLIFAAGTVVSMALLSSAFGLAIATGPLARNVERVAPVLGVLAAAFGIWYAAGALGIVAYPF
ncbi:MAG TPA: sulfite exporter TauE/SafE family protein [Rubrobacteraceae bacterium]|nr:sulfite exporter TauE/SafE family protein [Rubrobacteraceae bacterium]